MIVLQIGWMAILLLAVPYWVGQIFADVNKGSKKPPFLWISGQMLLWAGFQLLCVPVILRKGSFGQVVLFFSMYTAMLLLLATVLFFRRKKKQTLRVLAGQKTEKSRGCYLAWGLFWGLLAFQLMMAVVMTYADGDDSYYVAMSGMAVDSNVMYQKIPYTGWPTELDVRHGLAPFPIWIAYLSEVTGIRTVCVAHIAVPLALIPMTYGIYYLLADRLFAKRRESIPVFLIFTEILVLFGDYSFYSVENFMLARSRQGKAALGSIVIPMLILLLLLLMEKLQEQQRTVPGDWILLASILITGCLCSTLGALLTCMLVGITGLCAAFCYRRWRFLIPMAACCIPCVIYAGIYLLLA